MRVPLRRGEAVKRLAFIHNPLPDKLGVGSYFERGFASLPDVEVTHFDTGQETEGFDEYWYVDDGPSYYMEPKYRPAAYIAIDFVIPHVWFVNTPDQYVERMANFDRSFVFTSAAEQYCQERGLNTRRIGFAADPEYHRPHDVEREYDWIAVWHNCGDRIAATEAAYAAYPAGRWLWAGGKVYAEYMSRGKCALNWARAEIVNMRVFEVMAIGTPLITTRLDDMDYFGFVEGEHYLGYNGIDEMLDKIGWVQDHQDEARMMADRARRLVLERNTYRHRAMEIAGWLQQ